MSYKIGVVIPVLNYFKGAVDLVESIKSKNNVKIYIQPQHRHQVPLAVAWNKGFQDAVDDGCKYIAILNDDVILSPECLDNMVNCLEKIKDVVLVSANNLNGQMAQIEILDYKEQYWADMTYSEHPNYSCFMVKRDFFDKVGSFDANFSPAWYEDNDSHRRINLLGYKAICTTYASCIHLGSMTSSLMPPEQRQSSKSREYYIYKWGGLPSSHPVSEEQKEKFMTPYNDPTLTPKDWGLGK